ncbi:MAG: PDZ domain-containing protein [Phycisphaerae bacterium]|nr:PDZ domain-containing protein [Phycisphaerae bacterium]
MSRSAPASKRFEHIGPALVVIGAALLALVAAPMAYRGYRAARTDAEVRDAAQRLAANPSLDQFSQASRDLARIVEPSVVHVSTAGVARGRSRGGGFASSGSGWIWDANGHIVTNAHVVDGAGSIEVQLYDGERYEAELVGMEIRADVAVLRIRASGLRPALRSLEEPRQGELVFAFGSPFDFRFSMSSGIISGIGRTAGLVDLDYENFIQVDAAINPGNSGGPLTDIQGRVIGMNTAIATGRGNSLGQGQSAGIGLAIPMEMIESIVTQLIERGRVERGFLGVSVVSLPELAMLRRGALGSLQETISRSFQGDGAVVSTVVRGSPAHEAGLRVGDVILTIAGVKVTAPKQVFAIIGTQKPGAKVKVEVWRPDPQSGTGSRVELDAVLVESDPEMSYGGMAAALRDSGLTRLVTATPEACAKWNVAPRPGVLVEDVAPRSIAASRISSGAIIVAVDGQSVSSVDDLYTRLVRSRESAWAPPIETSLTVVDPDGSRREAIVPIGSR